MELNPFVLAHKTLKKVSSKLQIRKLYVRETSRAYIFCPIRKQLLVGRGILPPFGFHLPGGGMDKTESMETALRREVFEELGITEKDITSIEFLDTVEHYVYGIPHNSHVHLMIINDPKLEMPTRVSFELPQVKWMGIDQLKKVVGDNTLKRQLGSRLGDIINV